MKDFSIYIYYNNNTLIVNILYHVAMHFNIIIKTERINPMGEGTEGR